MLPVSNICFYHCSRTNCRLHGSKNLYRNLDFLPSSKAIHKVQFMGPDSCYVSDLVYFVHYMFTSMTYVNEISPEDQPCAEEHSLLTITTTTTTDNGQLTNNDCIGSLAGTTKRAKNLPCYLQILVLTRIYLKGHQ